MCLTTFLNTSCLSLCFSRGHAQIPQRTCEEQLHGAELPRSQPSVKYPCQSGLRGAGQEERSPDRPRTGPLGGQPSEWAVGRGRHLRCGSNSMSCHAGLLQESLELHEPWPQILSGCSTSKWTHQVAARPPAGQEATAQEIHCWFLFILNVCGWEENGRRVWIFFCRKRTMFVEVEENDLFKISPLRGLFWLRSFSLSVYLFFLLMTESNCDTSFIAI